MTKAELLLEISQKKEIEKGIAEKDIESLMQTVKTNMSQTKTYTSGASELLWLKIEPRKPTVTFPKIQPSSSTNTSPQPISLQRNL